MNKSAITPHSSRHLFSPRFWSAPFVLLVLAGGVAFYFVVSAILGGIYTFSPVPFWDMWDGYLSFYLHLDGENWALWWGLNNEHRIILSRILFWLDFKLFNGGLVFLIFCNYLLALFAAVMFATILKAGVNNRKLTRSNIILLTTIFALSFSWVQSENFSWAFQSQFFMAQLLPLVALYLLFRVSGSIANENRVFIFAAIVGIACAGTMANGVLTLPCMTLAAFLSNFSRGKVLILAGLSVAVALLYLRGYSAPPQNGSPWLAISDHAIAMLLFTLSYLGSPFFYVTKGSLLVAQLAGGVLLLVLFLLTARILLARTRNILLLSLLSYEVYLLATALITASGRVIFGVEYAVSSRYTTPALMAWCTAFIMLAICYQNRPRLVYSIAITALIFNLSLLPSQASALDRHRDYLFERLIAALALEMNVRDDAQILNSYFNPAKGLSLADEARHLNISIFANPVLIGTREKIGTHVDQERLPSCVGFVESIAPLSTDLHYVQISGWIYRPDTESTPKKLLIIDESGQVVGAALSGQWRADVAYSLHDTKERAGFKGYLLSGAKLDHVVLKGSWPSCELSPALPAVSKGAAG